MRRRVPDTTKLFDLTGWEPRRTLDDILDDAIADARQPLLILEEDAPTFIDVREGESVGAARQAR